MLSIHLPVLPLLLQLLLIHNVATESAKTQFDYVIIGGGTAGLTLANRLSEDPSYTVAVIEAGGSVLNSPNVTNVTTFGLSLKTSIDWLYSTTPQQYSGNRSLDLNAGKALGGTSTINGMTYLRAESIQIDAWESLGNSGWNWASLFPFYKKSERFEAPNAQRVADGAAYDPTAHGVSGPVTVGWSSYLESDGVAAALNSSAQAIGYPYNRDANTGVMRGFTVWPQTLDASKDIRQDAARAYYWSISSSRTNLVVFANTTATKIIWDTSVSGAEACASGVEVLPADGEKMTIYAKKEVIVSAGAYRSPAILELSGVGNPAILNQFGIESTVPLLTVGENLQDQPNVLVGNTATKNFTGYPTYVSFATAEDLFSSDLPSIASGLRAEIPVIAATIATQSNNSTTTEIVEKLLTLQADLAFGINNTGTSVPIAELLWATSGSLLAAPHWLLLPFWRGSVHISSADPLAYPNINPNYWMTNIDNQVQAAAARTIRKMLSTPPLSNILGAEIAPGIAAVPADASDDVWGEYFKSSYSSNQHPVGTCAMMSQELGGVVDSKLKVYGTANVRVIDASVLPMQTSGHLSSTIYALAERAATIIKEDQK